MRTGVAHAKVKNQPAILSLCARPNNAESGLCDGYSKHDETG